MRNCVGAQRLSDSNQTFKASQELSETRGSKEGDRLLSGSVFFYGYPRISKISRVRLLWCEAYILRQSHSAHFYTDVGTSMTASLGGCVYKEVRKRSAHPNPHGSGSKFTSDKSYRPATVGSVGGSPEGRAPSSCSASAQVSPSSSPCLSLLLKETPGPPMKREDS